MPSFSRLLALVPLLALLAGSAVRADGLGPEEERALERIRELTAAVSTLRCDFTQLTDIPLFSKPVSSQGTLLFKKPDSLLWEYSAPLRQGLAFSGDKGFRWEEDRAKRVAFSTSKDPVAGLIAAQMLAWIRFDRAWIEANYRLRLRSEAPLTLELTPKSADVRSVLSSLVISFGADGIARSVTLREARGGATGITFSRVELNKPLDDREFR